MNKLLFIFLALLSVCYGQSFDFDSYSWEEEAKPFIPSEADMGYSEIILKEKRVIELRIEQDDAVMYSLSHKVKFLNSEEAIERNNKIYIPTSYDQSIEKQVARVIKPNGTVVSLNNDNILEAEDEETGRKYSYFALEGLELGSTIEYITILKYLPYLNGSSYVFQDDYLKRNVSFDFYYPKRLIMEFKSYNGFPELEEDTLSEEGISHFYAFADSIPALEDEKYQNYDVNLQSLSFKLIANTSTGNYNLNSFSSFAERVHNSLYEELDKKELKILDNYISAAKLNYARSEEDKISMIEDFIKSRIYYIEDAVNPPSDIEEIDRLGTASEFGLYSIYTHIFEKLGIDVELVATCNRYDYLFDPEFENYRHLKDFFLYFPKYKSYLTPVNILYRYPFIPYQYTENYGYFIKSVEIGGVSLAKGKVKYIESDPMEMSTDSMFIQVDFKESIQKPSYKYFRSSVGHSAIEQSIFSLIKAEEDKQEYREELVKAIDDNMEIVDLETKNEGYENFARKPFIVEANFLTESFTQSAGDKYIFKLGELIGPQEEMYSNSKRKTDIEFSFAKVYIREISFEIPESYNLKGLENCLKDLNFEDEDGNLVMGFVTTYSVDGNVVTISNKEYYNKIRMDFSTYYDKFREVINAAADFNKIVFVLEKN